MATTTTTIHVHNSVAQQTSNVVLMFLQPVTAQEDYVYSAWNVLNPSFRSNQQVELSTSFSASIAAFGSSVSDYTAAVGLPLGTAVLVTNPNDQSPVIGGRSKALMTPDQVGLDNECTSPVTDLSVIWYVNGKQVVETNNTTNTTLNPGYTSTFQLKQSVWVMFGQRPQITTTYTTQTFGQAQEITIPNGATDVYIEAYTDDNGIDTFRSIPESAFNALARESSRDFAAYQRSGLDQQEISQLRGTRSAAAVTKQISDVSVLPLYGDSQLDYNGTGSIELDGTTVTQLRCGIFATNRSIPVLGQEYRINGTYDDTGLRFSLTLTCSQAGQVSYFGPASA